MRLVDLFLGRWKKPTSQTIRSRFCSFWDSWEVTIGSITAAFRRKPWSPKVHWHLGGGLPWDGVGGFKGRFGVKKMGGGGNCWIPRWGWVGSDDGEIFVNVVWRHLMVETWDNDMIQLEITQLLQQRCILHSLHFQYINAPVAFWLFLPNQLFCSSPPVGVCCEWIQPSLHENGWCLRSRTIWPWPSSAPVANAPCASTATASQSIAGSALTLGTTSATVRHPVVLHPGAVRSATLRCPERLGCYCTRLLPPFSS